MSKASAIACVVLGGTCISIGGAYMLGAFGSKVNLYIPTSPDELKKDKGKKILDDYFPKIEFTSEGAEWASNAPADTFLKNNNATGGKSRLVVNWEKVGCPSSSTGKNWTGKIRWLWTFAHENKGFIIYLIANPSSVEDSKLSVTGVIYTLAKEGETNKVWKIKHHKKTNDNLTVSNSDNKLPIPSDHLKNSLKVKDNWGFTTTENTLEKLCKVESSPSQEIKKKPIEEFKGSWVWNHSTGANNNKLLDWSKDASDDSQWLKTFFGTLTPKFEDLVKDFSGTWKEEYFVNKNLVVS